MNTYKVISDNFTRAKQGSTVTETELEGLDLQALVDGGHLESIVAKAATTKTATQVEGE